MTIAFVGGGRTSTAGSTSGTHSVSLSALTGGSRAQVEPGDLVIAAYAVAANSNRSLAIGDGATSYTSLFDLYANDTYDTNLQISYKFMADPVDPTVVFGPTGGVDFAGAMMVGVFRGVDTTSPFVVPGVSATGTNWGRASLPQITGFGSGSGAMAVMFGAAADATMNFLAFAPGAGPPSGGNIAAAILAASTYDIALSGYRAPEVDAPFGPYLYTYGSDQTTASAAGVTLALRPDQTNDGAVTVLLDPVALAAAGTPAITGAAAIAIAPVGLAASGILPISGAASLTLDPVALAALGWDAIANDAAAHVTLGPVTLASAGALAVPGSAALLFDPVTLVSKAMAMVRAVPPASRTLGFGPGTIPVPATPEFTPHGAAAIAWAEEEARDFLAWPTVLIEVSGLAGGDSIAPECSLDGAAWFALAGAALDDLVFVTAITADGLYEFPAGALLRWRQTGASDPVVTVSTGPWFTTAAMVPPAPRALTFPAALAATRTLTLRD